jgi:hypothetical protein
MSNRKLMLGGFVIVLWVLAYILGAMTGQQLFSSSGTSRKDLTGNELTKLLTKLQQWTEREDTGHETQDRAVQVPLKTTATETSPLDRLRMQERKRLLQLMDNKAVAHYKDIYGRFARGELTDPKFVLMAGSCDMTGWGNVMRSLFASFLLCLVTERILIVEYDLMTACFHPPTGVDWFVQHLNVC